MKLNIITILLGIGLLNVHANTFAQKITLKRQNTSIENIIKDFEKQSGYVFFYKKSDLAGVNKVSVDIKSAPLTEALKNIFENTSLNYEIFDKTIVIKISPNPPSHRERSNNIERPFVIQQEYIRGKVVDENNNPMGGVSLALKSNARRVVATDKDGNFTLPLTAENEVIVVSFLGYKSIEFKVDPSKNQVIKLEPQDNVVEDVIITGVLERRKESFTGATATFSGEELKVVNNQNIVQSLRALDPSFIQIENNAMGSNPNMLPTIELRGQTSITTETLRDEFSTDPNQPLFILDGFETNLRTIVDLDMNIVESVTILKDAASTAIYGSRASNGVIVIETIKPKAGKVQLNYTSDWNLQVADLRSYNMMNAREKLEFERLSGRYYSTVSDVQLILDSVYSKRLQEVERGVDTYWLSQPLQSGYSQRHSISARGGEGTLLFDAGANYKATQGLMIGNKRQDYGANLQLNYRANRVNISNRAFITGYSANESPYGSFSTWANTNPYFRLLDESEKYLDIAQSINRGWTLNVANPLYNARLKSYDLTKGITIANNLQANADITNNLMLRIGAQINRTIAETEGFLSPLHTQFDGIQNDQKGSYTNRHANTFSYTANAMLTYAKVFHKKHSLTANLRTEFNENNNQSYTFNAVGFPATANGNPSFSFGYPENERPNSSNRINRRNSFLASANYSYDQRYNADISYTIDGSTAFGSNKLYSPYFSFGLGWNLHRESFLNDVSWLDVLRLRGNIGVTGNQNFGNVSQSVYDYNSIINRFGQGAYLTALGAPDLEWQRTKQTSVGIDGSLLKNRINFQINAYEKYTDPLVVAVTLPSSTGLSNYPFNAGTLNVRGVETIINYSPIYKPAERIVLTFGLTGTVLDQKYSKFDNKLNSLNNELRESNSLTRYRDGYSPRDIWAVPSLGIDPATGREVFLTSDGEQTFYYSTDYQTVVGNTQPLAEGVLRSSLSYKGFTASVIVRYIWGRDQLNTALYNKVENISLSNVENNQDRRALYDRWQNPGDEAQFKAISITSTTPISSRFVQREHSFSGESFNFGYEFRDTNWLNAAQLRTLRINGYMNDIFYSSTIRRERGIDFPFARSISMSLVATFK